MATTVTAAFKLLDQASGPLKKITAAAELADSKLENLGKTADTAAKGTAGLKTLEKATKDVADQSTKTNAKMGINMEALRRKIQSATRSATTDIGRVEAALKVLDKETARPEIDLQGAGTAIAMVRELKRELNRLQREQAKTQLGSMGLMAGGVGGGMAGGGARTAAGAGGAGIGGLGRLGLAGGGIGAIFNIVKIPAIISLVGAGIQAVSALGAGIVAILPRLADMTGILYAAPASLAALAAGAGSAMFAFQGLGAALEGDKKALRELTPEARKFLDVLKSYKPIGKDFRETAQEALFPKLGQALERGKKLMPTLESGIAAGGRGLGRGANRIAGILTKPSAMFDLNRVLQQAEPLLVRMGDAIGYFARGMIRIGRVAEPFTKWLFDGIAGFGKWVDTSTKAAAETGRMGMFLDRAKTSLQDFGDLLGSLWGVMRNIGRAARPLGEQIWGGWIEGAKELEKLTSEQGTQAKMLSWFMDMQAPLHQLWMLTKELGAAFADIGRGPEATQMLQSLRRIVPDLKDLIESVTGAFGPTLVDAFRRLLHLLEAIMVPMETWAKMIDQITSAFQWLSEKIPGLTRVVAAFVAAFTFAKLIGGLQGLSGTWARLTGQINLAATAQARFNATAAGGGAAMGMGMMPVGGLRPGYKSPTGGAGGAPLVMGAGAVSNSGMLANMRGSYAASRAVGAGILPSAGAAGMSGLAGLGMLAKGAGKMLWPVSALFAGLGFLQTEGGIDRRLQGAASSATFGIIPAPKSKEELYSGGQQAALDMVADKTTKLKDINARIKELRVGIANADEFSAEALRGQLDTLKQIRDQEVANKTAKQQASAQEAMFGPTGFAAAYQERLKAGMDPAKALRKTTEDMKGQLKSFGKFGSETLAQLYLDWAKQQAQLKPKLEGPVSDAKSSVEDKLQSLYKNVKIVNGEILANTETKWKSISKALRDPVELARQENKDAFTQLQAYAVDALTKMGYSPAQARRLVTSIEKSGGHGGQGAQTQGPPPSKSDLTNPLGGSPILPGGATGMRLPGVGSADKVPVTLGMAAPGELIVNGPTEQRVNSLLGVFGTSLGHEVGKETQRHRKITERNASRGGRFFAKGGILPAGQLATNMGLSVSGGPGYGGIPSSGHATNSLHYQGLAYDVSGSADLMRAYFLRAAKVFRSQINELFYDPMGWYIDEGQRVSGAIGGHSDHVHIGFFGPLQGGISKALKGAGALTGAMAPKLKLKGIKSKAGGYAGVVSNAGMELQRKGMEAAINKKLGRGMGMAGGPVGNATVTGKATWFTGGTMASGLNTDTDPGIALNPNPGGPDPGSWNNAQTQTWLKSRQPFLVKVGGKSAVLPVLDMGPAGWTGNAIDVNLAGVKKLGYSTSNFPSGTQASAQIMKGPGGKGRHALGGRLGWGGWHGRGGAFTAYGPTMFGAGESGTEDVKITPKNRRVAGRSGGGVVVHIERIENHREGDISRQLEREFAKLGHSLDRLGAEDDSEMLN